MDAMDFLKRYVDVIHPARFRSAIASEAKKDDAKLTFLHVLLISLLGVLALAAYVFIYTRMLDDMFNSTGAAIPAEVPALKEKMLESAAPLSLIVNFVASVVSFYVVNVILFYICRALGGNGKLGNQLYATSVMMVSISVLYTVVLLLGVGPLTCISMPLAFLLMVYALFLTYVTARAVHTNLTQWKAVAAVLVPMLIFGIMAFVVARYFS